MVLLFLNKVKNPQVKNPQVKNKTIRVLSDNSSIGNKLPEVNSNSTLITIGCTPGYGYDPNSPNPICVPLDGSEKPEGVITCSALGCPYNPPNPNANQPIGSGNSLTK